MKVYGWLLFALTAGMLAPVTMAQTNWRVYIDLNLDLRGTNVDQVDSYGSCWATLFGTIRSADTYTFRHWIHESTGTTVSDSGTITMTARVAEDREVTTGSAGVCYRSRFHCVNDTSGGQWQEVGSSERCVAGLGGGGEDPPPDEDAECPEPETCDDSPIVIDLGQHGYRLTSASDGVVFDLRNDGQPVQIGWTQFGVENAFLALDRDGNGSIDNGAELFGNFTPLRSGSNAPNGFAALRELDANGDTIVDVADPAWTQLLLWVDRNHDGSSTADELQPIASSIVTGLETDYRRVGRRDQWGNIFRFTSHARFAESRRTYYDIYLVVD